MNKRFFPFFEKNSLTSFLNGAQTEDGFISKEDRVLMAISGDLLKSMVHRWRSEGDGILVGATMMASSDNLALNVPEWAGPNQLRILLHISSIGF